MRPTNAFTWDHIHYLEVAIKIMYWLQCLSSNCCGGHLGFHKMPQINSVRGLSGIKVIYKCKFNPTCGFQSTAFTSNILYRV